MRSQPSLASGVTPPKPVTPVIVLLTPKEAARLLKLSPSWLAKARMRGDGPPYIKLPGRTVRYIDAALIQWTKSRQRLSTSEQ
jgi:predicted DNA-binding transcriptional regulator AlpA